MASEHDWIKHGKPGSRYSHGPAKCSTYQMLRSLQLVSDLGICHSVLWSQLANPPVCCFGSAGPFRSYGYKVVKRSSV